MAATVSLPSCRLRSSRDRVARPLAQIQQLFRVPQQHLSRRRQGAVARGALEDLFAHRILKLADGLAHRRLRTVQSQGRPREAVLLRHGNKGLQLIKVHD